MAGTVERNGTGVSASVEKIKVHAEYNTYWIFNDIALLILETEFKENDVIKTIKLSEDNRDLSKNCTIVGWGRTSYPDGNSPEFLQHLPSQTILYKECEQRLAHISYVQENQICTLTNRGEGACHGDSGGPLVEETVNEREVIGIVSWGSPCANGYPDVFTKVAAFRSWIDNNKE